MTLDSTQACTYKHTVESPVQQLINVMGPSPCRHANDNIAMRGQQDHALVDD